MMTSPLKTFPMLLFLLAVLGLSPLLVKVSLDAGAGASASIHAVSRHGSDADAAQVCKNNPSAFRFYNPATKRTGLVCQSNAGWAVVILDELGQEVTSFIKNKMKTFDQVLRYMQNAGYYLP